MLETFQISDWGYAERLVNDRAKNAEWQYQEVFPGDDDGDGVPDHEYNDDDNDGIPDDQDTDDDGDGIADEDEGEHWTVIEER